MKQLQRELKKQEKKNGKVKKIIDELIPKISKNYGLEMAEDVYDIAEYIGEENIWYAIRWKSMSCL